MKKIFLLAVLILFGLSRMAEPLEPKIREGTLSIIQKEGKIESNTYSQKVRKKTLNAINEYIIHKDEQITVEIKDPNFFLFEYKWKGITKSKTEDFAILDKFIEALEVIQETEGIKRKTLSPETIGSVINNTKTDIDKLIEAKKEEKQAFSSNIFKLSTEIGMQEEYRKKYKNELENLKSQIDKKKQAVEANRKVKEKEKICRETKKKREESEKREEEIKRKIYSDSIDIFTKTKQTEIIQNKINSYANDKKRKETEITSNKHMIAKKDREIAVLKEEKELIEKINTIGITQKSLQSLSSNTNKLYITVKEIPNLICKISTGLEGAKTANTEIEKWGSDQEKAIIDTYGKIKEALRILSENTTVIADAELDEKIRENIQFISDTLLIFAVQESKIMEMIDKVNSFKNKFQEMYNKNNNEWIPLSLGTAISYSEKEKVVADIEILMADKIPEEVKNCLKLDNETKKTGKFQFIFDPYTPVKISFSLAEILSSLKVKGEDDENEKNIKLTVPMITITPNFKLWEINYLRLGFQIGGTVKDKTKNILMGAGLQLVERIFIGGGLHLRWGDDIDLKGGWYINIGFNVISTK